MIILLGFAFVSGLVTIAAPCIWPLLPVVLSSSAAHQGRRRPLGLTLGILVSFGVLTLSLSYLVHAFGLDADLLRKVAVIVLVFLGATLIVPALGRLFEGYLSRTVGSFGWSREGSGFWPGFVSGLPLGVVWAPCAGPILATIATLASTRSVNLSIVLVTLAYLIGIGIPLGVFAYAGQRVVQGARVFSRYTGTLQRAFGVVIILTAGLIFFDQDTRLEASLLARLPSYSNFLNDLEGNDAVTRQLDQIKGFESGGLAPITFGLFNTNTPAPAITGINRWLNLPPDQTSLNLDQLKGKVVLIDFWTYTCINCIRALPHVTAWYDRYKDDGLVVIGVHTPEFQFEHDTGNVQQAIDRFGIDYPVAQDNDYATWQAYRNSYWPAEYLIDKDGNLRRVDYGEGLYDEMEEAIRTLLTQAGANLSEDVTVAPDNTPTERTSPETYLGSERMFYYYERSKLPVGSYTALPLAPKLNTNAFVFGGDWDVEDEYSQSGANAVLEYAFSATHVYLVMQKEGDGDGAVSVKLDGAPIDPSFAGADVHDGVVQVSEDRLYDLVDMGTQSQHKLRLELPPGIKVYAFTFG